MKEYDVYVPRNYNDGQPIAKKKLKQIKALLSEEFGGVTEIQLRKKGWWKMQAVIFRDKITIFRVFAKNTRAARRFLREFKDRLKQDLEQEEILIVEKEARLL